MYAELHAHSFYSFGLGASHVHELLVRAKGLGYPALALTDANLCGALEFARAAAGLGLQPITGGAVTLDCGGQLILLARTRQGYANLSRLFTCANLADRTDPKLDVRFLPGHAEGLTLLTGGRHGPLAPLLLQGRWEAARRCLQQWLDWFGAGAVYVELQQNLVQGDKELNLHLARLAQELGVPAVATNHVLYHSRQRHQLQNVLTAIRRNTTLEGALPWLQPNAEFYLKSPQQMARLFRWHPQAVRNTLKIAGECAFNLSTDLGYQLPAPPVPEGYTVDSYLRQLCYEAAARRYGRITPKARSRIEEELGLIQKHRLAGFLLLYRNLVQLAQEIMVEEGLAPPETPLELRPPGRGRGSSVALVTGYLIGISHVDPLAYDLTLERFMPEDLQTLPDIDLDFPRALRDKLIARVHREFGPEHAVLAGAVATYQVKGIIAGVGKALGLPSEELKRLSGSLNSHHPADLKAEMLAMPEFREKVNGPGWNHLIALAPQLIDAPKGLGQHVGGMVLSSSPISEMTPIRQGAIEGRYIMDWDKDSVADAGFAKIDLLSLPVLDQIEQALNLIEQRTGQRPDLARINPADPQVYDMINRGKSMGVFLLQSPAQLKMGQRLKSRNLLDLAYQVALIRPGVGVQGSAVSQFVERYRHGAAWDYDHPLERRALERGFGIIVWQEQVVQLIMDVAGLSAAEADRMRRAFGKRHNQHLLKLWWEKFQDGARARGVPEETILKIFHKVNGEYMFPESHSHAFAISAYQAAWLKCHYPTEFFVALMNCQPMGFYPLEALKEDARRFGVPFFNPCVNASQGQCTPEGGGVRLGLKFVQHLGPASVAALLAERQRGGPYSSPGDLVRRVALKPQAVECLVLAGALDGVCKNRRQALWEAGLHLAPAKGQQVLPLDLDRDVPPLADFTPYEQMLAEYRTLGLYPRGHLLEFLRPGLGKGVTTLAAAEQAEDGAVLTVAGWPVARQHPRGEKGTVFVTIEDETGDLQLILWPRVFARCRKAMHSHVIKVTGAVSRWDGTANLVASRVEAIPVPVEMPAAHDWR
ncbi:MAG: DNA polymerase III subunit alpha [SAR202 cluster bacterium]|nr:DNA polymerase III subunit alpha [SAR202 cluster bacterium]